MCGHTKTAERGCQDLQPVPIHRQLLTRTPPEVSLSPLEVSTNVQIFAEATIYSIASAMWPATM